MSLVRFGDAECEKPRILNRDGNVRDLSSYVSDINGEIVSPKRLTKLNTINIDALAFAPTDARCALPIGDTIATGTPSAIDLGM